LYGDVGQLQLIYATTLDLHSLFSCYWITHSVVEMDRTSSRECREVLILGPRRQDYAALEKAKESMDGYNFHFLEPPQPMVFGSTLPSKNTLVNLTILALSKRLSITTTSQVLFSVSIAWQ